MTYHMDCIKLYIRWKIYHVDTYSAYYPWPYVLSSVECKPIMNLALIMNPKSIASTGSNSMHTPLIVVILLQNFRQSICSNLQCEMKYLN